MCVACGRVWTALHVLWALLYVCAGAVQTVIGIFFLISLPALNLCSCLWAGSWNVVAGIGSGMLACFGEVTPRRQEWLLYVSLSILIVNTVNAVLSEWTFYTTELVKFSSANFHTLLGYARVTAGVSAAGVLIASFLDSQLTFCSIDSTRFAQKSKVKKSRDSNDQVSDIEYIIPRQKSNNEPKPNNTHDTYAQSWVFDTENNSNNTSSSPYLKIKEEETHVLPNGKGSPGSIRHKEETVIIANPVVHIEEVSDESNSNSDRKLGYMKSFSRTPSPVVLSEASSQISLNNPPIYECLEKLTEQAVYRSRLNTALSAKDEPPYACASPRRSELSSPRATDQIQYASLIMELEKALTNKKDKNQITSPQSDTQTNSNSSRHESSKSESQKTDFKSSDAEFSKELEAALQLIQDLESPNTVETPSETCKSAEGQRPLAVWRHSDASGSEKTLSAVGSLAELTSPLTEGLPEIYSSFKPQLHGKSMCSLMQQSTDSQSTSGYSSPTHKWWSASSSIDDSAANPNKNCTYTIKNTDSSAVITLFSGTNATNKGVTVIKISGDDADSNSLDVQNNNVPDHKQDSDSFRELVRRSSSSGSASWNVKSLLRKKRPVPKLPPELEGAIIKSESLAHLTELELLARHERNREIQRQIEHRVQQQLGQMIESSY